MSRILRRPMFRGGRVDSRGTGITTGLMDGGRVNYKNAGFVSGADLMAAAQSFPQLNMYKSMKFNPKSKFALGQDEDIDRIASFTGEGSSPGFQDLAFSDQFRITPEGETETTEFEKVVSKDNPPIVKKEGIVSEMDDTTFSAFTKKPAVEEEPSTEPKATIPTPKVNEPDTEVTMTDLERALGLDDARKEYVGDALAAASKAFFEGKGFGAISDAAAVKSKAPDIKRLAGLEQFKADTRQKMYETKLKQGKVFAPGNTQKLINTFKKVDEGSQAHGLALMDNKLAPTIEGQIKAMTNADPYKSAPSAAEVIGYMQFYHPDTYKGVISADTPPTEDGTYILEDASAILFVKDGKTSVKKLK